MTVSGFSKSGRMYTGLFGLGAGMSAVQDALGRNTLLAPSLATFNVQDDYGAGPAVPDSDGAGGGTDNTARIQAALNAMPVDASAEPPYGGILYLPPGRYLVKNSIVLRPGTWILCPTGTVRIDFQNATDDLFIAAASSATTDPDWLRIENLKIRRVGTGATGWAINLGAFGSGGPIRTPLFINMNVAGFIKGMRLVSTVLGCATNCRFDGPYSEGGRDVAGGVGMDLTSCNGFYQAGSYINNYENGVIGGTSGQLLFDACALEHNGNGYWHQGGSARWEMPNISETPVSANLVDFKLDAGGCMLSGIVSHSIQYLNSTVKSRTNIIPASNDRDFDAVFWDGPAGIKLGDLIIQTNRRAFYQGIWADTPTIVAEKTSGYSAQWDERFFPMNSSAGPITLTLPEITADDSEDGVLFIRVGQEVSIQKVDSSANQVSYAPRGTDTIDGSLSTRSVFGQWDMVTLRAADVGKWRTIAYRMARTPGSGSVIPKTSNYANNPGNGDCMTADLNDLRAAYESLRLYVESLRARMDDA